MKSTPLLVCCLLLLGGPLAATQLEPRVVFSPINGKPFQIVDVPVTSGSERVVGIVEEPSAGSDTDGCVHDDINIYDHFVATCPYTFFTSLAMEYRTNGRFNSTISAEVKEWVSSREGFNSEWEIAKNDYYNRAQRIARGTGQRIPAQNEWVIPQRFIPVEDKYRYCYMSYMRRGANNTFLAKVSLNGAHALRAKMNIAFHDVRLKGGIEEVNERLERHIEAGATFVLEDVHGAYRSIFRGGGLSDEGYFVTGITLVGLELRVGRLTEAMEVLDDLMRRMDDEDDEMHRFFRGLIRDRRRLIRMPHIEDLPPGPNDYLDFLQSAAFHFTRAIQLEELPRTRMLTPMFTVGECYRRMGRLDQAYDWYLTLANMEETRPALRADIRAQGGEPSAEAGTAVMLGRLAEEAMRELEQRGVDQRDRVNGPDSVILNAILNQGLGTLEYEASPWQARDGGNRRETAVWLQELGLTVLDYAQRTGTWPQALGELWTSGLISDWNSYNRFHCPVTGAPYRYIEIGTDVENLPQRLVLVSTSEPVPTSEGPRYGGFTSSLELVWSDKPLVPGTVAAE